MSNLTHISFDSNRFELFLSFEILLCISILASLVIFYFENKEFFLSLFRKKKKIIFIEGNIASGKTTFIGLLQNHIPDSQIIYEPLEMWKGLMDDKEKNILDYFYSDKKKYAYPFQSYAFFSRVCKAREIDKTKNIIFLERSIFSDKNIFAKNCYETGIMTNIEWKLYNAWFNWMKELLPFKESKFIYLRCEPEISYNRLKERNRSEEKEVSLDYLKEIHQKHEEWFNDNDDVKVLDASKLFRDDEDVMKKMVEEIVEFIR